MSQGNCRFRRKFVGTGGLVASGLFLICQSFQPPSHVRTSRAELTPAAEASPTIADPSARRAIETLGERPLGFERNEGQFDAATRFAARGVGYSIYLTGHDAVLAMRRKDNGGTASLRMTVVDGAQTDSTESPSVTLDASEPLSGTVRYYRGQGASLLAAETQAYARVTRRNVYDGIDLVYYGNQQRLEYDFIVAPGRDPRAIRLRLRRRRSARDRTRAGDCCVHVPGGEPVRQHKPVTYQVIDGARHEVESRYVLHARQRESASRSAPYDRRAAHDRPGPHLFDLLRRHEPGERSTTSRSTRPATST